MWTRRRVSRRPAHTHRCEPATSRATMRTPAWFADDATRSKQLPCTGPAATGITLGSYKSPRMAHQNQTDLIDRRSSRDHNVTICDAIRAEADIAARAAPRPSIMIPSPLVSIEGALARPRVAPLDGVPPFGLEWRFGAASGTRSDERCVATLTTSCIDVDAPHRACHWQPLAAAHPTSAGVPVIVVDASGQHIARAVSRAPDRRARHAACWSLGALAIIGGLIVAHEPIPSSASSPNIHTAGVVPEQATQRSGRVQVGSVERITPALPVIAPAQHIAAQPIATPGASPRPERDVAPEPKSRRSDATPDVRRAISAPSPSPHRPHGTRATTALAHAPAVPRLAARPPLTHHASHTPAPDRVVSRSLPDTPHDLHAPHELHEPLDDPLALIAMANALSTDRPARAGNAPAADFDWTTQLSHRRLTAPSETLSR